MISKKIIPFFLLGIFALFFQSYGRLEGFYKDVFQDEGTRIDGGNLQVDCKKIDFSQEHLNIGSGQNASESEITAQSLIMIKSDNDANGYLLYPDNAPRYALIYYHGGYMSHAQDLGEEGIKRVRTFYYNGGSEFGSCAGSFMLSTNSKWFSLWPGKMDGPSVSSTPIDKIINTSSPLIGYNGIKAGDIIPGVYHNNGGSVDTSKAPKGTKFCTMHNSGKLLGFADIWTWKDHDSTGRVAGSTGHPEGSTKEEAIRYFSALMLYLADNLGKPRIKNTLSSGKTIDMNKKTEDNTPQFAVIGDKQYHHFLLECKAATNVKISIVGKEGYDFHVFVAKDTFAYRSKALHSDTSAGSVKNLTIPSLENGKWYVSVKLNTTVTADTTVKEFPKYSGKLEVLNGIAYSIKAEWNSSGILASDLNIRNQLNAELKNNCIIIKTGSASIRSLRIYDLKGRLCWQPTVNNRLNEYSWKTPCAGIYLIHVTSATGSVTKHISVMN